MQDRGSSSAGPGLNTTARLYEMIDEQMALKGYSNNCIEYKNGSIRFYVIAGFVTTIKGRGDFMEIERIYGNSEENLENIYKAFMILITKLEKEELLQKEKPD